MKFEKWQGCGNDFVLLDRMNEDSSAGLNVKRICDRHFGIGSDGLIIARPSEVADVRMQMFNPDGSEAEMCGNGIRCFAKFLIERGLVDKKIIPIETGAGVLTVEIAGDDVIVDMGAPILEGDRIPVLGFGARRIIDEPITIDGREFKMTCVSMGNPHCVVFVDDLNALDIGAIGPKFETDERFPRKINTEFVEVIDRSTLRMRVWERGAGITLACGTGACATAAAGVLSGRSERRAKVILDGGELELEWRESDNRMIMSGSARKVFEGQSD